MGRFAFSYTLNISFLQPVFNHRFCLRCVPRDDSRQKLLSISHNVLPHGSLWTGEASFGSLDVLGLIPQNHNAFLAETYGSAEIQDTPWTYEPEGLLDRIYAYPSSLTRVEGPLRSFLNKLSANGTPSAMAVSIAEQVSQMLTYTPNSTTAQTSASEAFLKGQGVCQDYVHICLAALRSKGIAARYVAGLIPGTGESHAWLEVREESGWYGYDPTNGCEVSDGYLKFVHGRDAADCFLNRGVFHGGQIADQKVLALITKE